MMPRPNPALFVNYRINRMPNAVEALKIDVEPKKLLVTSEPYVVMTSRGFVAAINVIERRSRREFLIYIGAMSLSKELEARSAQNGGKMLGLEFWIRKSDPSKFSPYVLED